MYTLPWNSAGHTLFLFFASFRTSKSALCHLLCEATCSLGTDKQLGNVTTVVEYSKIVTAQQLGDRIMHIIHIFVRIIHISRLKYNSWIAKPASDVMTLTRLRHANKLELWIILKISFRAKAGVSETLAKRKLCLHSLYFPQNSLTLTESSGEFSDLHSILDFVRFVIEKTYSNDNLN